MRKLKKCKICSKEYLPSNSLQRVCSIACSIEDGKKKLWEKEKQERKEKLKTHGDRENELQPIINEISALLDKGMNCICCGAKITNINKANAGHRFAVGGNNTLRFNLHNLHKNGVCCNKWKNGNPDGYDDGLIKMYGKDYFEFVKWKLKELYPQVKLTATELIAKRAIAMKVRNELKKLDLTYTPEERIALRDKINKQIGIYNEGFNDVT
jgi:hypothetical protein